MTFLLSKLIPRVTTSKIAKIMMYGTNPSKVLKEGLKKYIKMNKISITPVTIGPTNHCVTMGIPTVGLVDRLLSDISISNYEKFLLNKFAVGDDYNDGIHPVFWVLQHSKSILIN
jgi:hypothetical protein